MKLILANGFFFVGGFLFCLSAMAGKSHISNCYSEQIFPSMGTTLFVKWSHVCGSDEIQVKTSIRDLLHILESELSTYQPGSKLSKLNSESRVLVVSPDFHYLLEESQRAYVKTQRYFNIAIVPVLKAIKRGFTVNGRPPAQDSLEKYRALTNPLLVKRSAALGLQAQPGVEITFDGIAKGYAVRRVRDILLKGTSENIFINFSGNIYAHGVDHIGRPWTVRLNSFSREKSEVVELNGRSLSTSSSENGYFEASRKWHHIVDPVQLRSAGEIRSLSIVGPDPMIADMLSTAIMAMPAKLARKVLLEGYRGYQILDKVNNKSESLKVRNVVKTK